VLNIPNRRLVLAHFWLAFLAFFLALILGEWQMYIRSPLHSWLGNPELYYRSVTAHGSAMGYVFPTLVAMGFGYAIVELALKQVQPLAADDSWTNDYYVEGDLRQLSRLRFAGR